MHCIGGVPNNGFNDRGLADMRGAIEGQQIEVFRGQRVVYLFHGAHVHFTYLADFTSSIGFPPRGVFFVVTRMKPTRTRLRKESIWARYLPHIDLHTKLPFYGSILMKPLRQAFEEAARCGAVYSRF